MNEKLQDRILGCLYGQAVGNALGLITEFCTKEQVAEDYPGGLKRYDQAYPSGKGVWEDDDTNQMLCLLDELTAEGEITEQGLARRFVEWFETDGRGCGTLMSHVIFEPGFLTNPAKAAFDYWERTDCYAAPNGALMRTACVGLLNKEAERNAAVAAGVTHADRRCVGSCAIATLLINRLVWDDRLMTLDELKEIADRYDPRIAEWITKGATSTIDQLELDKNGIGYTLLTLAAVVWAAYNAPDFETGLVAIVNQGGDADTNAAIACAVLGAKFGLAGIPPYYIENLANLDLYRRRIAPFVAKVTE